MYDDRTNLSQQVTENLSDFFDDKLLKTTIPRNIRLAEAPSHGKPVALYDPSPAGPKPTANSPSSSSTRNNMESPEAKRRKAAAAAAAQLPEVASSPREKRAASGTPAK